MKARRTLKPQRNVSFNDNVTYHQYWTDESSLNSGTPTEAETSEQQVLLENKQHDDNTTSAVFVDQSLRIIAKLNQSAGTDDLKENNDNKLVAQSRFDIVQAGVRLFASRVRQNQLKWHRDTTPQSYEVEETLYMVLVNELLSQLNRWREKAKSMKDNEQRESADVARMERMKLWITLYSASARQSNMSLKAAAMKAGFEGKGGRKWMPTVVAMAALSIVF